MHLVPSSTRCEWAAEGRDGLRLLVQYCCWKCNHKLQLLLLLVRSPVSVSLVSPWVVTVGEKAKSRYKALHNLKCFMSWVCWSYESGLYDSFTTNRGKQKMRFLQAVTNSLKEGLINVIMVCPCAELWGGFSAPYFCWKFTQSGWWHISSL